MKDPEEVRKHLALQWFRKADEDLRLAEELFERRMPYGAAIVFHCQQAAEKFLKSLLTWCQIEFPKTHDLLELINLLASRDPAAAEELQPCAELTPYAVEFRYPGDLPEITIEEMRIAVTLAEKAEQIAREALGV